MYLSSYPLLTRGHSIYLPDKVNSGLLMRDRGGHEIGRARNSSIFVHRGGYVSRMRIEEREIRAYVKFHL